MEHIVSGYVPGVGKMFMDIVKTGMDVSEGKFDISNMIIANRFTKPYREDKAFNNAYFNLKGKTDMYKSMLDAYKKDAKNRDDKERAATARDACNRITGNTDTEEHKIYEIYKEADRLLRDTDKKMKKGNQPSKEDIKELDDMIIKWNKR
jgi:hypothetical protein